MNQMGNLEKLGILVIVILVVVVGVVAITPKETLDPAVFPEGDGLGEQAPVSLDEPRVDPDAPVTFEPADRGLPFPSADIGADGGAARGSGSGGAQSGGGVLPPGGGAATPSVTVAAATTEYVVQKGDSGEAISKKTLGRRNGWADIAALNPGLDARKLQPGQKIVIPARADAATPTRGPASGGTAVTPPSGGQPQPIGMQPTPAPQPSPAAESSRTYVVQPGDTLSDIARRELGSASKWRVILDANTTVLHGSEVVRPGMKLAIPARSVAVASSGGSSPAPAPAATGTKTYKVQSGDTLSSIASRLLGSSGRWKEIVKANEGLLHGGTDIRPGMELRIPEDVSAR